MTNFKFEGAFKKLIFNLIIVSIVGIAIFFMGEAIVRIFYKDRSVLIPDPIFHHVHNKRFKGQRESPKAESPEVEYRVMVKFNSYGFRDYEYAFKKPEETTRLIILGDSFVDALEVELEENFVKRMERRLNRGLGQNRYEVLNFGLQGYSTVLEYLVLKNIALKFNSDLIITCFYFNDISDNYIYRQMMVADKNGLPWRVIPPGLRSQGRFYFWGKDFLCAHSRLYGLFRSQYYNLLSKIGIKKGLSNVYYLAQHKWDVDQRASSEAVGLNPYAVFKSDYSPEDERVWGLTYKFLLDIKSLADMSGNKLVLVILPAPDQVAPYEFKEGKKGWLREENSFISSTNMQDRLVRFCHQNKIEVLDVLPALRCASHPEQKLFFDYNGHFNKRGHQIMADEIYNYLIVNKLLPVR